MSSLGLRVQLGRLDTSTRTASAPLDGAGKVAKRGGEASARRRRAKLWLSPYEPSNAIGGNARAREPQGGGARWRDRRSVERRMCRRWRHRRRLCLVRGRRPHAGGLRHGRRPHAGGLRHGSEWRAAGRCAVCGLFPGEAAAEDFERSKENFNRLSLRSPQARFLLPKSCDMQVWQFLSSLVPPPVIRPFLVRFDDAIDTTIDELLPTGSLMCDDYRY